MLLTLTSTAPDATDLGFLLHKHPDRVQSFSLPVGTAHVFYPQATPQRCTVALLLEVDPVGLVRGKRFQADGFTLAQYVNDRPYAASSLLAVALARVFGTAMKAVCTARPELPGRPLPLTVRIPAVPARRGGADLVGRLFGPLGWDVRTVPGPLDAQVPRWGESPYVDVELSGTVTVAQALNHLYVLLPVLDDSKHYWVGDDEVTKLVRSGGSWLADHPDRQLIARRYLRRNRLAVDALERLAALDDAAPDGDTPDGDTPDGDSTAADSPAADSTATDSTAADSAAADSTAAPRTVPLVEHRKAAVLDALRQVGARRVVDLGCGEGVLLRELLADPAFSEVVGVDVSARELAKAERRLGLERMPDGVRSRLTLRQSSATYRDRELEGYDAVVLMEVVEHLDPDRLPALERSVFRHARPGAVVVTTPNADYNVLYDSLAAGRMRHRDHRFEWSRAEFGDWVDRVCREFGYDAEHRFVGSVDPDHGGPTQLALFTSRPEGATR